MPRKKSIIEDSDSDFDMYDTSFEQELKSQLTSRPSRTYSEDVGFNNFDQEGVNNSWKTDAMW